MNDPYQFAPTEVSIASNETLEWLSGFSSPSPEVILEAIENLLEAGLIREDEVVQLLTAQEFPEQ